MEIGFEKFSKCFYCDSDNLFFLFKAPDRLTNLPGEFSLCRCKKCGLVFQNPRVKEKDIGLYYTDKLGYYNPPAKQIKQTVKTKAKNFLKNQTLVNHFNYPLSKKNFLFFCLALPFKRWLKVAGFPKFKSNGSILDIGCSHGEFLEEMKNFGWQAKGIEMDEKSAVFAREKRSLEVSVGRVENCHFEKEDFDAITMRMVLEHLYNPFEVLKIAASWLKKGGELIFSIPYFDGFEFNVFKSFAYGLQLPTHIFFFNKKIIRKLLKENGFAKIKFYHHFFDRDIVVSSQYKYQENKNEIYKFLGHSRFARFFIIKPLVFILALLDKTSRITVMATKK